MVAWLYRLQVCGTVRTDRSFVNLDVVRFLDLPEGMALVAFLTTTTTTCLLAQAPSAGLLQTIAAWRLAAVPTVLGQLVLQGLDHSRLFSHFLFQGAHLLLQRLDNGDEHFFIQLGKLTGIQIQRWCHSEHRIPQKC